VGKKEAGRRHQQDDDQGLQETAGEVPAHGLWRGRREPYTIARDPLGGRDVPIR
jgi:hypothetical protein